MDQDGETIEDGASWLCWYCTRVFQNVRTRHRHMVSKHRQRSRLVPPPGFVELHLRPSAVERRRVAAAEELSYRRGGDGTASADSSRGAAMLGASVTHPPQDANSLSFATGGLGVVGVRIESYARGTLPVRRPRPVFHMSIAARIQAYYEGMAEASQTQRLVPQSAGQQPSRFDTPLLRQALKFALCAGGAGLSQADQGWYVSVLMMAESGAVERRRHDSHHGEGGGDRKRRRLRTDGGRQGAALDACVVSVGDNSTDGDSSAEVEGEIARAFPSRSAFVAAVRQEQRRVLSKLFWDETPLEVEGTRYVFYSRDLLLVVLDLLQRARHVQLWGEQLGVGGDGTRLRSAMMDSDLFLAEEVVVRERHGSLAFVLAVQLFVDEAVVSWSGAHYVYPIRARVLNVRDRSVQWVTVAYVPHVGKAVARTAAARRCASDARNGVLQRCLAILLRRFVGASRSGVPVEFPGRQALTAVPRLVGLVADQLGERSVVCLMGNACEYFCSHCVVRRDVAGGAGGVNARARDVTAVLDAQLDGALTRDRDPRPSLRTQLKTEHSALAFVPAIGAVWGLVTDLNQLYNIISFDLLHVWKLGVVRMVAQRFPSFLRVACAAQDARLGPVGETLEALNLRAWEMGHLNVPSPTPPGYVSVTFKEFSSPSHSSFHAPPRPCIGTCALVEH